MPSNITMFEFESNVVDTWIVVGGLGAVVVVVVGDDGPRALGPTSAGRPPLAPPPSSLLALAFGSSMTISYVFKEAPHDWSWSWRASVQEAGVVGRLD